MAIDEATQKWIERLVIAAVTAAVAGGGTYKVKESEVDRVEAMMTRLEGIADACRGYEPADASPVYRQGYRAQEAWKEYQEGEEAADVR